MPVLCGLKGALLEQNSFEVISPDKGGCDFVRQRLFSNENLHKTLIPGI